MGKHKRMAELTGAQVKLNWKFSMGTVSITKGAHSFRQKQGGYNEKINLCKEENVLYEQLYRCFSLAFSS